MLHALSSCGMFKKDKTIMLVLLAMITLYIAALLAAVFICPPFSYISLVNAATSASVLFYWVNKQLRISQHVFELRETITLVAECLFAATAVYTVLSSKANVFFSMLQYIIFGLHFIALLLLFIYMCMFKMKRLF